MKQIFRKAYIFLKSSNALCLLLGVLSVLALPPFDLFWILFLTIPAFWQQIISSEKQKESFWRGWWFGLGYFTSGLYWIGIAMTVDLDQFAWLIPFASLAIPAVLAIYTALTAWCFHKFCHNQNSIAGAAKFALLWLAFEILRGWLFTGFPWNMIGYSFTNNTILSQIASVGGVYLLSFLAIFLPCLVIVGCHRCKPLPKNALYNPPRLLMYGLFVSWLAFGLVRLSTASPIGQNYHENINLRLVQANIEQSLKWSTAEKHNIIAKHLDMSKSDNMQGNENDSAINLAIWSETSMPIFYGHDLSADNEQTSLYEMRLIRQSMIAKTQIQNQGFSNNHVIITGGLRLEDYNYYNSMLMINGNNGKTIDYYDKIHLVPFGEYIPLRRMLGIYRGSSLENFWSGIAGAIATSSEFLPGNPEHIILPRTNSDWQSSDNNNSTNHSDNIIPKFRPLICYEVIFPSAVINKHQNSEWLLNITNDNWFGNSSGPYQHLAMARLRAIENGKPLIRVAGSGVSAIFDSYGRIWHQSELLQEAIIDSKLPKSEGYSLFAVIGKYIPYFVLAIAGVIIATSYRKKR